jgi:glycosyltransferase involved in cell wall biosynthesis
MDICVLSTFTEGVSNSILEYMALEKPVVATIGGGTSEIVIDNETGFLINPSNPKELADKLGILLENKSLRTRMGSAGKKRVIDEFSVEKMVNKYIDLYKLILSKKPSF